MEFETGRLRHPLLPLVLALAVVAAACGGGAGDDDEAAPSIDQVDTTAEIRIAADEDTWPSQGEGAKSTTFAYPLNVNVYEPLIYLSSDYELRPGLAERWELVEPNTWRFHLRRGVVFHDGSPLTADDVMWSWAERQMGARPSAPSPTPWGPTRSRRSTTSPSTSPPRCPTSACPSRSCTPRGPSCPGESTSTTPSRSAPVPSGSSPTRPARTWWWSASTTTGATSPRSSGWPSASSPTPRPGSRPSRPGDVDFAIDLPPDVTPSIEADSRFQVVRSAPGRNQLIYINKTGEPPFDLGADPDIREAVSLAIDRETYVDTVFEGNAEPGRWMAPESVLGDDADIVGPVPFDPERSRQILDQAGWEPRPDGTRVKDGRPLALTLIGWAER